MMGSTWASWHDSWSWDIRDISYSLMESWMTPYPSWHHISGDDSEWWIWCQFSWHCRKILRLRLAGRSVRIAADSSGHRCTHPIPIILPPQRTQMDKSNTKQWFQRRNWISGGRDYLFWIWLYIYRNKQLAMQAVDFLSIQTPGLNGLVCETSHGSLPFSLN